MVWRARAAASALAPELYAGWPQQVCAAGTMTSQPAASSSRTAAKPTLGRSRSTRQVTNSPTLGRSESASLAMGAHFPRPAGGVRPSGSDTSTHVAEERRGEGECSLVLLEIRDDVLPVALVLESGIGHFRAWHEGLRI